ncbi:MAG TPA: lysylphosphatidylglycerol synthase transmembrane domain-containing protein [Solirubrobacteraceae bacterium]|nr:lysylphosphatidylglycerol synthase transmembrane domain-containing protein [Solirubrobacteraceae bacterium]
MRREDLEGPPELGGKRARRRLLWLAVVVIGVIAVITLVPGLASLRTRLEHGDPKWLAVGAVLKVLSGVCYSVAFRSVFCRRMKWGTSFEIGFSELGANAVLPIGGAGGLALGAWALRRGGMDAPRIARRSVAFFFLTSVPNVLGVIVLGTLLAAGVLSSHESVALTAGPAGLAIFAVVATILGGRLAKAVERRATARRGTGSRVAATFRALSEGVDDALDLLRHGGPLLLLGLVGYLGFDVMILWATFHAFGDVPSLAIIWFGYLLGELGGLIPLPGGIGGVDLGLVGAFTLYHVPVGAATAAVLGYRALALLVPVVIGAVAFVRLRRSVARETIEVAGCLPGQQVEIIGVGEAELSA